MTLSIDRTGKAPANFVLREARPVNTTTVKAPLYKLLGSVLFFTEGLKVEYLDTHCDLWPLFYGKDYDFSMELHGLVTKNPVAVLVRLRNLTLNGTLYFSYQSVGGKWRMNQQQMAQHLLENASEESTDYRRLVFLPHLYDIKTAQALQTNVWDDLEQAQTLSPYGVFLGIETHPVGAEALAVHLHRRRINAWKAGLHAILHYGPWGQALRWTQRLKRRHYPLKLK